MSIYVKSIASDSVTLPVHKGKGYQRGCHILMWLAVTDPTRLRCFSAERVLSFQGMLDLANTGPRNSELDPELV